MMQYRNGLIGKHFKTLMQTAIFHIHDMVSEDSMTLIRVLGELGPVLWASSIDNMDVYLVAFQFNSVLLFPDILLQNDLTALIDNVLDAFANLDPSKILIKIKLHMLVHLPSQIRRRGPAVRFSTEVFECFNAVFRMCSVLSNHQAPSRDIAVKFADLDRVKHILSGGFWQQDSEWVCAGKDVRRLLRKTTIIQKHLGWAPPPSWRPGSVKRPSRSQQKDNRRVKASETELVTAVNVYGIPIDPHSEWLPGMHVTAISGDQCRVGSFVVFKAPVRVCCNKAHLTLSLMSFCQDDSVPGVTNATAGRISRILLKDGAEHGIAVIEVFEILHQQTCRNQF
jgi:hypothetical protein